MSMSSVTKVVDVFHAHVLSAHCTSCHSLVQDVIETAVHVTHAPHTGLGGLGVLGQPVIDVVDVEGAGATTQALDEGRDVELLETRPGAAERLTATRGTGRRHHKV